MKTRYVYLSTPAFSLSSAHFSLGICGIDVIDVVRFIKPIHAPGAVQGFGVLIALVEDEETGNLVVRQVSEVILLFFLHTQHQHIYTFTTRAQTVLTPRISSSFCLLEFNRYPGSITSISLLPRLFHTSITRFTGRSALGQCAIFARGRSRGWE